MNLAIFNQKIQDWITQQWVILFGVKVDLDTSVWLKGPFGNLDGIGQKFINELKIIENLHEKDGDYIKGLITSIEEIELTSEETLKLSKEVIDFYENTSEYNFELEVNWNPFFRILGVLLKLIFSNRIQQLNIPLKNNPSLNTMESKIIHLFENKSFILKRIVWLRYFKANNQVIYSGVYEICRIPSGKKCIKAIFPLPNGNATVILSPMVGKKGELILNSCGKHFGDPGFYFILKDRMGITHSKYLKSFEDKLTVRFENNKLNAEQQLCIWGFRVVNFHYNISKKLANSYN